MKLKELIAWFESEVPLSLQESYDNSGLQLGELNADIDSALICLDITEEVIDEAVSKKCSLIISHHPLIFKPLKSLSDRSEQGRLILKAVQKGLNIYSMHTNLDIIKGGVSYKMAEKINLKEIDVLVPLSGQLMKLVVFVPSTHAPKVRDAMFRAGAGNIGNYDRCSYNLLGQGTFRAGEGTDPFTGKIGQESLEEELRVETVIPVNLKDKVVKEMIEAHPYEEVAYDLYKTENPLPGSGLGCIGDLEKPVEDHEFLKVLGKTYDARGIRHNILNNRPVKRVAVMGGSGAGHLSVARAAGADAYITADIKYHSFFEAGKDLLLVDIGHFESEIYAVEVIDELIKKKFPKFAVRFSEINTNPVNYLQAWQK